MPPNQDDKGRDVATPDSDFSMGIQNDDVMSTSSASEPAQEEPSIYETIELPQEPTLKELVQRYCNCQDVSNVTIVKLIVIAADVSLQHLSYHTPLLRELILDGSVLSSLRDLGCGMKCLKILRVNQCGLVNLDGSYGFDGLEELYLARNKLTDISQCANLISLTVVDASNNFLNQIESLFFLSLCNDLKEVTLQGNDDVTSTPNYRKVIKELIPQLVVLDGKPFTPEECHNKKNNNVALQGSGFLPPVEKSKTPSGDSNSSFTVTFPPKILSPNSSQRSTSTLPPVRVGAQRDVNVNRILPEIKNRLGSVQRQSNL